MNDTNNPELMKCPFCDSEDIFTERDIGSDINADDDNNDVIEERQHRDVCRNCRSSRFRFEAVSMRNGPLPVTVGEWGRYDPELERWMRW